MYALMQAMGMVNDHAPGCITRAEVERARAAFSDPEKSSASCPAALTVGRNSKKPCRHRLQGLVGGRGFTAS
jgi:hypothetical protein